ncbi:MAG: alanine--tRNA ligase [Phycisphaerales bacterium]|nr:alanine--tRNA ligase [Phycisphaerales bacterium]
MQAAEIRAKFISYFEKEAGHTFAASSPVVPYDDPTLLFTNAGMNQFKDVFLGRGSRPYRRAVNTQKCIRAGGKHNDLEDVGRDVYHHTFFEMLGNWSFGDYFKQEAIRWAWELLTGEFALAPERLYATWFEGNAAMGLAPDHEARDMWLRYLPAARVLPGNMKDNFWEMGETGPCGPCSEIHFDRVGGRDAASRVNSGDPDVLEIWNLVFIQFNREADRSLKHLPARHVDTGMGLERLVSVIQKKRSNYDTDLWSPLFAAIERQTGARTYGGVLADPVDTAYRVIADHVRCLTVAACDGAGPGNDGRNYVLRRILRRAARHGRQTLGVKGPFLHALVPSVVETLGCAFPEIGQKASHAAAIIGAEEEAFARTMDRGLALFDEAADRGGKRIAAEDAFRLHDTFGFPVDLTAVMAQERGLTVDTSGYELLMDRARATSRAGTADAAKRTELPPDAIGQLSQLGIAPTDDSYKYEGAPITTRVVAVWNGRELITTAEAAASAASAASAANSAAQPDLAPCGILTLASNFYAEAGGQEGDRGEIHGASGLFAVTDTQVFGGYVLHIGSGTAGQIAPGDEVSLRPDAARRQMIRANHTATHMLNWALREVVGEEVQQKGSLVAADKLRFDYSVRKAPEPNELGRVEQLINEWIDRDQEVDSATVPLAAARPIQGLRAVFGERYPDPVRVVSVGARVADLLSDASAPKWQAASVEFCGGTHLASTGAAVAFMLLSEGALAAGVRRVFGLTGAAAMASREAAKGLEGRIAAAHLLVDEAALAAEITEITRLEAALSLGVLAKARIAPLLEGLRDKGKAARKRSEGATRVLVVDAVRSLIGSHGAGAFVAFIEGADAQSLFAGIDVACAARADIPVMLLGADAAAQRVFISASCPKEWIARGLKAGDWVKLAAQACGGSGGGKPDAAQAGGKDPSRVNEAIAAAQLHASKH